VTEWTPCLDQTAEAHQSMELTVNPVVNLRDKFDAFDDVYTPKLVAQLNDYEIKCVKIHGSFVWHSHADTDELFFVVSGVLDIELREQVVTLHPGEMFVVPRGVEHRPNATEVVEALLIEPAGVVITGAVVSDLTAEPDDSLMGDAAAS
jgi:mannose-6-phosphate isomerase-like protein (cupin superfamily)